MCSLCRFEFVANLSIRDYDGDHPVATASPSFDQERTY